MLGVSLFIAFWVVLGLGLFFMASRRGSAAEVAVQPPAPRSRQLLRLLTIVIYVGFGVALPLVVLTGNHTNANAQVGGIKLTAAEKSGRELFGQHCAVCHTLAAANAIGKVGPNLDQIQPSVSLVEHTIQYGCLQNPNSSEASETCLGEGTMPSGIVQPRQASQIAQFVARVAGKE